MIDSKWNNFVSRLIECKKKNVVEKDYHSCIEFQLQLLGWTNFPKEINHKVNLPIGNHGSIQPDILIGIEPNWKFVIEVKRPNHVQTKKECDQLTSYMRQLKLSIGIYIGECIEIFYDRPSSCKI
ncbi:MAG: hypothetical protein LKG60_09340 [Prevotella sp.]|jgi:hypothetical protein|nr:hypothetical protein [Prevotella sp.]